MGQGPGALELESGQMSPGRQGSGTIRRGPGKGRRARYIRTK